MHVLLQNFDDRLEVVDLDEIEDADWEFPDRDFFNASDREAPFKMIRITNRHCEEEEEMMKCLS